MKISRKFGASIEVIWLDAYTDDKWGTVLDAKNLDDERFCYSKGWYIGREDGYLIMCHTKGKTVSHNVMGKLYIPLKWIVKVK